MLSFKEISLLVVVALACVSNQASAVSITLGDQDFSDGQLINGAADYLDSQIGEPSPFDSFIGSDLSFDGSTNFTFAYSGGPFLAGSIDLGLFDHDSMAPGNQINHFSVNGIDLTSALNTLVEGHGGAQDEYNVYTLSLTGAVLAALNSGSATFLLGLHGLGLGGSPGTFDSTMDFNGFGLDFARLNLTPATVPEPTIITLMLIALAGMAWSFRVKVTG